MAIAVAVGSLLVATLVGVLVAAFFFTRWFWRWAGGSRADLPPAQARPLGQLPTLADPVGPLGSPAPDADLSSTASNPDEIYGG